MVPGRLRLQTGSCRMIRVTEHTIRQRYERGLLNFRNLYRPLVDEWMILDGSALPPQEVARCREDRLTVTNSGVWKQFLE